MTLAIVALGVILLIVATVKGAEHLRHPENIAPPDTTASSDVPADSSSGSDRPAGADAEDPVTEVPNRAHAQPPGQT